MGGGEIHKDVRIVDLIDLPGKPAKLIKFNWCIIPKDLLCQAFHDD